MAINTYNTTRSWRGEVDTTGTPPTPWKYGIGYPAPGTYINTTRIAYLEGGTTAGTTSGTRVYRATMTFTVTLLSGYEIISSTLFLNRVVLSSGAGAIYGVTHYVGEVNPTLVSYMPSSYVYQAAGTSNIVTSYFTVTGVEQNLQLAINSYGLAQMPTQGTTAVFAVSFRHQEDILQSEVTQASSVVNMLQVPQLQVISRPILTPVSRSGTNRGNRKTYVNPSDLF